MTANTEELIKEIENLKAQIEMLSIDQTYGVITRAALPVKLNEVESQIKFVCFFDLDGIHNLNEELGYQEVDNRIKQALQVRSTDLLIKNRWYSGDEITCFLSGNDPEGFCNRLMESLKQFGLSATIAYTDYTGDYVSDIKKCSDKVQSLKGNNIRGIYTMA
jgi:GGDEF domain-containing protein